MRRNFLFKIVLGVFVFTSVFVFLSPEPAAAAGATLFLSPGSGNLIVNKAFNVKVMVNSGGGIGINAAEAVINFDPTYLSVSRLNDSTSIFKLWTTDPTYSNSDGTLRFGGGAPGAYKDSAGTIFVITFNPKKEGETEVKFSSGVVLAADGKGTNVFSGFGNGKYTIGAKQESESTKPKEEKVDAPKGILPPLPEISSESHPDEDAWYSDNNPEFFWKVLSDLTNVSFKIDGEATTDPGAATEGIVETTVFEGIEDGKWYFHVKYQNRFGWGQVAHKGFMVDVTPPEAFTIAFDNDSDSTNPKPKLRFKTEDKMSGIDGYVITNGIESIDVSPGEIAAGYYSSGPLAPGEYNIDIAAVDKAGNAASSTVRFIIDALKAPIITSIPKILNKKDELVIRGDSFYPRSTIDIYIAKEEDEPFKASVMTDDSGGWTYFHRGELDKGNYEVWAKVIDDRGAQSLDSTRHLLTVVSPSIIDSYGWLIILILVLIIIFLLIYIYYEKKEFTQEKMRIFNETEEAKSKLSKIFQALREEVDELIEMADKKPGLSESERKVKEKLQESLDISEEFISKEVEDVEKEIKLKKPKEIK